ncbi:MAG: hypothetical protein ACRDAO_02760 [Culicoidibacterales bacterium]
MKIKLFDYGLMTTDICQKYGCKKKIDRAVGFGKLFTDGVRPILFPEGDDNDKFYGSIYEISEQELGILSQIWPAYQIQSMTAYTVDGEQATVAFVQTFQQIQHYQCLAYPEWKK